MGRIMKSDGKVEFRGDGHAERFAEELRTSYGAGVVAELAAGRTETLAADVEDRAERKWIARAIVSAAKTHVTLGLTLKEARDAEMWSKGVPERAEDRQWER